MRGGFQMREEMPRFVQIDGEGEGVGERSTCLLTVMIGRRCEELKYGRLGNLVHFPYVLRQCTIFCYELAMVRI